jgi:hypothetical protein
MKEIIATAIERSISHDEIVHVDVEADDIYTAIEGVVVDDMIQLEHGEWDVWGSDEDAGGDWRLHIYLTK